MAVVPNTEATTTGPGAGDEAGSGAPETTEESPGEATVAPAPAPPRPSEGRLPHVRALDGLRGLAVLAVLVYHLDLGWFPGGFLGVSLFFTLSGFLITSLVLAERSSSGGVALGSFWGRRFRRLLPAAWAGLALAVVYAAFAGDADQLRRLPGDIWAAVAYGANWRFLFAGDAYAAGYQAPSPILHYWSLAIEEQFYVLFPLLVAGLIAWKASRRVWFAVVGALIAVSMVSTVVFFDEDETTRVYFSSLSRMGEILAGVLLALVLEGWWRAAGRPSPFAATDRAADDADEDSGMVVDDAALERAGVRPASTSAGAGATPGSLAHPVDRATLEQLVREPGAAEPATSPADGLLSTNGAASPNGHTPDGPDVDTGEATADDAAGEDPGTPTLLRRSPVPMLADGRPRTWVTVLAGVALVIAVVLWARTTTSDLWVYRGGLFGVAIVSCVLVLGAITAGPIATALAWRPLVFVGAISYGIYVYHWPLFQWLSPERTGLDGIPLAILRVAVTFGVAIASYRWLERPIRDRRVQLTRSSGGAALAAILVVGMVAISLGSQADARALEIAQSADATPVVTRPAITSPNTTQAPQGSAGTTAAPLPPPKSVLFIGDSLLHQAFPVISADFADTGVDTRAIGGPGTSLLFDQARWLGELQTAIDESQPDVVVIESCCGYDEHREPYLLLGAPLVPDTDETWLVWQHAADQAVDMAHDAGALVLWVLAPPAKTSGYYGPIEGRIDRANAIALELPDRHPCLGFVDWRVIAAPDGSYTDTLPGLDGEPVQVRAADGLHFTPAGMNVLAEVSRTAVLDDWQARPESCRGG